MTSTPHPLVVLVSARGTLAGIDGLLRRAGVRLVRLESMTPRPMDPTAWLDRIARSPRPDTVIVTSRAAVDAGVRPWRRVVARFPASLEFWAAGPGTAQALRRAGVSPVHRPRDVGAMAIAQALGPRPARTIVYFRSDLTGTRLARALRARRHRVVDLAVYHLQPAPRLAARSRADLLRADLLVVTSASGLSDLRRRLDRRTFARLCRATPVAVLGELSRQAAEAHGFLQVLVAPSTTAQRFTRFLLRELRHARV